MITIKHSPRYQDFSIEKPDISHVNFKKVLQSLISARMIGGITIHGCIYYHIIRRQSTTSSLFINKMEQAERKHEQLIQKKYAVYEILKARGKGDKDDSLIFSLYGPRFIKIGPNFTIGFYNMFINSPTLTVPISVGVPTLTLIGKFYVTVNMFDRNYVKENCPKIVDVGVRGLPNTTYPTGFYSNYQLATIGNKSCSYSVENSVEQVPQKIAGHDTQRCMLLLKQELEFESSESTLQRLPPEELLPILQQLMPLLQLETSSCRAEE